MLLSRTLSLIEATHRLFSIDDCRGIGLKPTLLNRLDQLVDRYEELAVLLSDPEVIKNQTQFVAFSQEYSDIEPVVELVRRRGELISDLSDLDGLLSSDDKDMKELAESETLMIRESLLSLESELQIALIPGNRQTQKVLLLRLEQGLVVMRPPYSLVILHACI